LKPLCKVGLIAFTSVIIISLILDPTKSRKVDVNAIVDFEEGKFLAETNRDFIIFWAVLFFTCIVGLIELLSELNRNAGKWLKLFVATLYFLLVVGIILSMSQCWNIYRVSYALTYNGKLGPEIENFIRANPSLIDQCEQKYGILTNVCWEIFALTIVVIILVSLYCAKNEWL